MLSDSSVSSILDIKELVDQTAVDVAWKQWTSLGAGAASTTSEPARSVVDPEALVLLSLSLLESERRLADFLAWWAEVGAKLLSVQRYKTQLRQFPERIRDDCAGFARLAIDAGDLRWRPYASEQKPSWATRGRKGGDVPHVRGSTGLLVRLRAGFGVNAKADALAFLIGSGEDAFTTQQVATAIGYGKTTVHVALQDMVLARLIHQSPGQPATYRVQRQPWSELLELASPDATGTAEWRYWLQVHSFLAQSHDFLSRPESSDLSEYVVSSKLRDLVAAHRSTFSMIRLPLPDAEDYRGAEYIGCFLRIVQLLNGWCASNV